MIAGNKASLKLGSVDLCKCWHQDVIQAEQPRLVQGAGAVNVEFDAQIVLVIVGIKASLRLGSLDLCDWGHHGVTEAEQPGLMQGVDAVNVEFCNHLLL